MQRPRNGGDRPLRDTTPSGYTEAGAAGTGTGQTGRSGSGSTADDFDAYDATYYKRHFDAYATRPATASYDEARTGYQVGHRAAANPTYAGRTFQEIEVEIEREYGTDKESKFEAVRDFARHAFEWKTLLGGLALAAGGWWAGQKIYEVIAEMTEEDEKDCRTFYEAYPARATLPYDRAHAGYSLGYVAARNPEYSGRTFDQVEVELQRGFAGTSAGSYEPIRDFTRRGYERGTARTSGQRPSA